MSNKKKRSRRVPGTKVRPRKPGWKVTLVGFGFCHEPNCKADHSLEDPAEAFGYTVGLHQRHRLPELHMGAAPDDGDGAPIGYQMVGNIINALAEGVIARTYHLGEAVAMHDVPEYGTIVVRLGEPVPRNDVQAFAAHPRAEVIPVTWATAPERQHSHDRSLTVGAHEGAQVSSIAYTGEQDDLDDYSGFILEYEGAPPPWEWTPEVMGSICMGCLVNTYPEVGRGLEVARRHGTAELVDGRWAHVHYGWQRLEEAVAETRGAA